VHLVFTVLANYSLTIKLILVNQHLLHTWSGNLSTSNLCTPDTRGRAPTQTKKWRNIPSYKIIFEVV